MDDEKEKMLFLVVGVLVLGVLFYLCKGSSTEKFKLDNVHHPPKGRYWGGVYYGGFYPTYGLSDFYYMDYPFTYGPNCEKVDKDSYCGPWRPIKVAIDSLDTGVIDEYRCCRKYY